MIPKSLRLVNFFSYKDSFIDFEKLDPITMIIGAIEKDDRRNNGAGKTTLIEAILYSLYEKTRLTENKNATLDDMVRWNSDGQMTVIFEFELNQSLYKITRTRDSKRNKGTTTFEVKIGKQWKSCSGSNKNKTNQEIVKVIGIDYDTFCASICFQAKEVDRFVEASESQRKAIIKDILKLDRYDELQDSAKAHLQNITTELKVIEDQLKNNNIDPTEFENKKKDLETIQIKSSVFEQQKQLIESELEKLRKKQILFNDKIQRKVYIKAQIKTAESQIEKLNQTIEDSNSKLVRTKKISQTKKQDLEKEQQKLDQIKIDIDKQQLMNQGKAADQAVKQAEADYEKTSKLYHQATGDLKRIEKNITDIEKLETARCPTCFNQITQQSKQSSVDFLNAHKKIVQQNVENTLNNYQQSKDNLELNKKKLEQLKQQLQDFIKVTKEKLNLEKTIGLYKEAIDEAEMLINDQKSIIEESKSMIKGYQKDLEKYQNDLQEIVLDQDEFDTLNDKINQKNELLKDSVRLLSNTQIEKGKLIIEVEKAEEKINKVKYYNQKREQLSKEKYYYDQLVKIFGKQIPSLIIENTCYELGEETNKVLKNISNDSVEFVTQRMKTDRTAKEVFEIEITRPGVDKKILIDNLSTGQKFRVVFAIRVALSRLLVRRRSSASIDFLFYDECFGSLDPVGIDDVIDVFKYLTKEFKYQLVITHRPDLKERFGSNIIQVNQKNNGISEIIQE